MNGVIEERRVEMDPDFVQHEMRLSAMPELDPACQCDKCVEPRTPAEAVAYVIGELGANVDLDVAQVRTTRHVSSTLRPAVITWSVQLYDGRGYACGKGVSLTSLAEAARLAVEEYRKLHEEDRGAAMADNDHDGLS